jgi:transmembrane sensor
MPDTVNDIDALACEWATRVSEGTMTAADAAHLERWLSADTRHRGAFVRAQAGWLMLTRTARAQATVEAAVQPHEVASEPAAIVPAPPVRRTFAPWRMAAVAAAACVVVAAAFTFPHAGRSKAYGSGVGEVRSIVLEDGSTATIGSSSAIEVTMGDDRRALALEQGEAWFDVAHNPQRPFVVSVDDVQVRAVGTAFAVSRSDDGIDVLVSEGVVETWRGDGARERVPAGQTVHSPPTPHCLPCGKRQVSTKSTACSAGASGSSASMATLWRTPPSASTGTTACRSPSMNPRSARSS